MYMYYNIIEVRHMDAYPQKIGRGLSKVSILHGTSSYLLQAAADTEKINSIRVKHIQHRVFTETCLQLLCTKVR